MKRPKQPNTTDFFLYDYVKNSAFGILHLQNDQLKRVQNVHKWLKWEAIQKMKGLDK